MSFTFFCNQCLRFASDGKRNFWTTSCMHVFCEMCFSDKQFCKLCGKACNSMAISREMPSDVRSFFEPNSVTKLGGQLQRVWDFQSRGSLLFSQRSDGKQRYSKTKEYYFKYQEELKAIEKEIHQENAKVGKLKAAYA